MGFWDKEELVGTVTKNKRGEVYQVRVCEKRKRTYLDIRTMYPADDGELLPGKGVAIPLELASEVFDLITMALSRHAPQSVGIPAVQDHVLDTIVRDVL